MTPLSTVAALVCPGLQTSSFTVGEVAPTVARTWSVCHLHAVVGETLLMILHLLSKVSGTSMLALAGPTASTSSRLVSPPLAPSGPGLRSTSLASTSPIVLMLGCPPWEAHSWVSAAIRLPLCGDWPHSSLVCKCRILVGDVTCYRYCYR